MGSNNDDNGPLSRRRNDSGKAGFEKREKRRNIRRLQTALCDHDIETVREILNSEFEVDFQYNGQTCLQVAVCQGWEEACAMLIKKGADVNHSNAEGNSLLNMACWRGYVKVARLLVDSGADVDSQNVSGNTPLNVCAHKGFTAIADILLFAKSSTNLANKSGQTPLFCVSRNGNVTLVSKLLAAGADPNWCDYAHVTPLMVASQMGHTLIVKELLSHGADLNCRDRQSHTAVFEAANSGQTEILKLLYQYNADLNLATVKGVTPLLESISENQPKAAKTLIELGCDVNQADKTHQAPIHAVIRQVTSTFSADGNQEMRTLVRSLVGAGADVNLMDSEGWTPLYQAALSGDVDMSKVIMAQGASLTCITKTGCSLLHAAVLGGSAQVVKMFLQAGCEVNVTDNQGLHPLLAAITFSCNKEVIEMLLDAKSDLSLNVHATKNTALHEALLRHQAMASQLLIDNGSSLTARNLEKQTPLYLACKSGMTDAVTAMLTKGCPISGGPRSALPIHAAAMQGSGATIETLADHGCDLNEFNEKGETPIMTAINQQNFSAVRALLQCGCDLDYQQKLKGFQLCCLHHGQPHPHFELEPLFLAVTLKSMDIVKMLLQCYSEIPRKTIRMLRVLLQKTRELNVHFTQEQKLEVFKLFAQYTDHPFTLEDICRRCIRGSLGAPLSKKMETLPVGEKVKRYILMEEEFNIWMEVEKEKPGGSHGILDVFVHSSGWK